MSCEIKAVSRITDLSNLQEWFGFSQGYFNCLSSIVIYLYYMYCYL